MTKEAAIQQFFQTLLPSYPAAAVPKEPGDRYLTYELRTDNIDGGEAAMTVNLWFYSTSEAEPNAMARKLSEAIGHGGVMLACDGGRVWLKRGSPWCQSLSEGDWKRRYINVTVEFLTAN